jgi:hypothetical protein
MAEYAGFRQEVAMTDNGLSVEFADSPWLVRSDNEAQTTQQGDATITIVPPRAPAVAPPHLQGTERSGR